MRIRFIKHEDYNCPVGEEWQGELKPVGHTIVAGHRIAANGILKPFVEDITEYRTEIDEDGNKIQVEVIPEVIDESPDAPDDEWLIIDIKEWLFEHEIPFKASMTKAQLLDLVP